MNCISQLAGARDESVIIEAGNDGTRHIKGNKRGDDEPHASSSPLNIKVNQAVARCAIRLRITRSYGKHHHPVSKLYIAYLDGGK